MRLFSQNVKVEALGRAPLFEGLSKKELTELARVTDDLALEPGTVLCREGKIGREFFVLVDGSVDVIQGGKRIATLGGGDFIGEIALLTDTRRTATVKATTPLRCFVLTAADFRRVLDENRGVERKVMRALAERLLSYAEDAAV
ncbi:MAG TPA: cyclic nucleotide-binding domain-containing protein [Gaiellaceae bacterium]|nr:cyclic nucleotide-binding domain-containing protein [Gaiellaceae bacterium]